MSTFFTGQTVMATVTCQGMKAGKRYVIADVNQQVMPWGTFCTYTLIDTDGRRFTVVNLHLLAELAIVAKPFKVQVLAPKWSEEDEQWVVAVKINGKLCEARTYYTDDRVDALTTCAAMRQDAEKEMAQ